MSKQTRIDAEEERRSKLRDLELFVTLSLLGTLVVARRGAGFEAFGLMALWTLGALILTLALRIAFDGAGTTLNRYGIARPLSESQERLLRFGMIIMLAGGLAVLMLRAGH